MDTGQLAIILEKNRSFKTICPSGWHFFLVSQSGSGSCLMADSSKSRRKKKNEFPFIFRRPAGWSSGKICKDRPKQDKILIVLDQMKTIQILENGMRRA